MSKFQESSTLLLPVFHGVPPTLFWFDISISYPSMLNLCAMNQHPHYHYARQASQLPKDVPSASGHRCKWTLAVVNTQSGEPVLYETCFRNSGRGWWE